MQRLTLIACQGPAFFLEAQVTGNSVRSLCICLTPVALGIKHKLCITIVFLKKKLISPTHSPGLFANGNSGMGVQKWMRKKMKWCESSCDSMVPPLLSKRWIVNRRPLGCENTPSGPYPCSGKNGDYCQGIRAMPYPSVIVPLNLTSIPN